MALPASPPISLLQVCAEFGAPAGTPLTSFLRGGAWVPNTPANAAVPAALPINILQLLGASSAPASAVNINSHTLNALRSGAGVCDATYTLEASGLARRALNGSGLSAYPGEWLVAGVASSFEVRYTLSSGLAPVLTGGSYGAWINMGGTTVLVQTQGAGVGTRIGNVLAEIRPAGGGSVLSAALIEFICERS